MVAVTQYTEVQEILRTTTGPRRTLLRLVLMVVTILRNQTLKRDPLRTVLKVELTVATKTTKVLARLLVAVLSLPLPAPTTKMVESYGRVLVKARTK
jgi:hypothetical protein